MIKGPQDEEDKEKFKIQTKDEWDKVIRSILTHKWQPEVAQISETINNTDTLSTFITCT
jgi:hypothetical protein